MSMMPTDLNAWVLFDRLESSFAEIEVVTRTADGLARTRYGAIARRARQLMNALDRLGLAPGARVATLAWNTARHLECYFAIPCTGRVLHTLNARLSPEDLAYIIGHAEDEAIFVEPDLVPLLERAGDALRRVAHVVVLGDVPASTLPNLVAYEDLIGREPATYARRAIPESTPFGLCYTSGTTGRPKGVVYTHRSTFLHTLIATSTTGTRIGPEDTVLPVVPMFHANAWGAPFGAAAAGAKLVLGGRFNDPASLVDLLEGERVTIALGVPTVWLGVADELDARDIRLPDLRYVICGGSRPPPALAARLATRGIPLVQAWGMTETSPIGAVAWPKQTMRDWHDDERALAVSGQAGLPPPGVEIRILGDDGQPVERDGKALGDLEVRGPWVASAYFKGEDADRFTKDGWFKTGDVAVGSEHGYFVIADRTKDLIKSGGEWISSVEMEVAIADMPQVAEVAVIGVPDAKWQERPLPCVVPKEGAAITIEAVRDHLAARGLARWQLPTRLEILASVPRTSVGKFDKKALRARYAGSTP